MAPVLGQCAVIRRPSSSSTSARKRLYRLRILPLVNGGSWYIWPGLDRLDNEPPAHQYDCHVVRNDGIAEKNAEM